MLRLYFCPLPEREPEVPPELLSAYRREKLQKQKNALVRLQSLWGELLLRYALRDSAFPVDDALDIAVGEYGKPFLRSGECFFSLSHSAQGVLCALSERELGADLQIRSAYHPALIDRFFTAGEGEYIRSAADPDAAFTELWTKKESVCKCDGRGLALLGQGFSVLDEKIAPQLWHGTRGDYHLACFSDAIPAASPEWIEVETSALFP